MGRSLLALAILLLPVAASADGPSFLWVVPLEGGRTLDDAWAAGAVVRDELPDALIVADPASAAALAGAGFRMEGPLPVTTGEDVFLLRNDREADAAVDATAVDAVPGVDVLWTDGRNAIVETEGVLPPADAVRTLGKKRLSRTPLARPRVPVRDAGGAARATSFSPVIDQIVAEVDSTAYFPWIERLAGEEPVLVGGNPVTFTTRYSRASQCDLAEQYVYEQFQAMGFPQVEYDPFTVGGTPARNVIATLPGAETPERIYILCGHLDSTSPVPYSDAPGANDNASGTAGVLAGADVLKDYTFRSTIKFIAFTGEEQGLIGSEHYAVQAAAAGDSILGVVNLDMIAFWDTRYEVLLESKIWAQDLVTVLDDACAAYTGLATDVSFMAWGSDHVSFLQRGFPAVLGIEMDWAQDDCYHRTCDRAERTSGSFGAEITRASLATVAHLAGILGPTSVLPVLPESPGTQLASRPNPFTAGTTVRFRLPTREAIDLAIYDVTGRRVRTLAQGSFGPGAHERAWDGLTDAGAPSPAGIYFARLGGRTSSVSEKLIRLR